MIYGFIDMPPPSIHPYFLKHIVYIEEGSLYKSSSVLPPCRSFAVYNLQAAIKRQHRLQEINWPVLSYNPLLRPQNIRGHFQACLEDDDTKKEPKQI